MLNIINNEKIENIIKMNYLQIKVEKKISEYIGFDVNKIFDQGDYITIYGGAVRDSLADLEINDVDILCMSKSAEKLRMFLQNKCNYKLVKLYDQDKLNMYKGLTVISEPWTFINSDMKIIQIIRPRIFVSTKIKINFNIDYVKPYYDLIKNVDLSCCGVFLIKTDNVIKLGESCKNAIVQCLAKKFIIQKWAFLFNIQRITYRTYKLENRGWKEYNGLIKHERQLKLIQLKIEEKYLKIWKS